MVDITFIVRQTQVIVLPETDVGQKWIKEKMVAPSSSGSVTFIQRDVLEEFMVNLENDGIIFEER